MENRFTGVFEQVEGWWIGHVEIARLQRSGADS
jgi:hypothetical protein